MFQSIWLVGKLSFKMILTSNVLVVRNPAVKKADILENPYFEMIVPSNTLFQEIRQYKTKPFELFAY